MMANKTILITGANGEIGHALISHLAERPGMRIVALDMHTLNDAQRAKCYRAVTGDILDIALLESLSAAHDFDTIYHLAALLSTKSERQPTLAHRVNVDGTLNLLELAMGQSRLQGREITFLYPSSIAVYGLPDLEAKRRAGRVKETEWLMPITMYGINKLYCERLGGYYARYYRQLDAHAPHGRIDFRGLRFPGLISATTIPAGGTSDYAAEMLHCAAQHTPYACFVRADSRIPFMTMPDAVNALLRLESAPRAALTREVYNVGAFNPSAGEIYELIRTTFPDAQVSFEPDDKRQRIVDSWPIDLDDTPARADWGWAPTTDVTRAFREHLIPGVARQYHRSI